MDFEVPLIDAMSDGTRTPFRVLIATLLSLRTKDEVTAVAAPRLFALAQTPRGLLELDESTIAQTIYPVGFYKTKAATIHKVCQRLLTDHDGRVPNDLDELLELPGVGRKTANLVLGAGYGKPSICVDTHVHRICNRWGILETKAADDTEMRLRKILPRRYWLEINRLLVALGQNHCKPMSPFCSTCELTPWWCKRVDVGRSR